MKQLKILILLAACVGLSMQQMYGTTTTAPPSDPCDNYSLLSQEERNLDYVVTSTYSICDAYRFVDNEWYRFDSSVTGGKMPEYCITTFHCSTSVPIWMNGNHPTEAYPGPVTVEVCGNTNINGSDNCYGWSEYIQVKYCPAKAATDHPYYVYQLKNPPECDSAYCTMKACKSGYARDMQYSCVDIDECLTDPCYGGLCVNEPGSYICFDDGQEITTKMPDFEICDNMPCLNGYCTDSYHSNTTYCVCYYGYTGSYCETFMPCWDNPCGPGVCNDTGYGHYQCTCPTGVYGKNCSSVDCDYNPCMSGDCISHYNGSHCSCEYGYTGVICEKNAYGSSTSIGPPPMPCTCYNGGTCQGSYHYYYCDCQSGYTGQQCEIALNCNSPEMMCYNGGTCEFSYYTDSYNCTCQPGYYGKYCEYSTSPSTTGYPWYENNTTPLGLDCNSPYINCYNGGSCLYSYYTGHYNCSCPPGTYGEYCEYATGTIPTTDYPWYENATTPSVSFSCHDYSCHNGGSCIYVDYMNSYCACKADYTGDYCEYNMDTSTGSCIYNPCLNGGTCFDQYYGGYTCFCAYPYTGHNCESFGSDQDPCLSAYCGYDGTCVTGWAGDDYRCVCGPHYTGPHCDRLVDPSCGCVQGTCNYNNTYFSQGYPTTTSPNYANYYYYNDYADYNYYTTVPPTAMASSDWDAPLIGMYCDCDPGYTGTYCDTWMTSCDHDPCENGGYCSDTYYGSFYCTCTEYFEGEYCDQGLWGQWYESNYCSRSCGGGYKTKTRYCLAGSGHCEGRSTEHEACNTQPCSEDDIPGIDIEIDRADTPLVMQNELYIPQLMAHIINMYCSSNPERCCDTFGYFSNRRGYGSLVTPDQCHMSYMDFEDPSSFVIKVSAYTTKSALIQFCGVSDLDYDSYDDDIDYVGPDSADYGDAHSDFYNNYRDEDMLYLPPALLKDIVMNNVDTIKRMTDVDILSVEHSALHQDDDDDNYDDDDDHEGHSKALVIGLSVCLGILGLIVTAGVVVLLCKGCFKAKQNRQSFPVTQPVPTVARPQLMYQQPTTPHDLFLALGANGMPPSYQQVVMYPPAAPVNFQNNMYGVPMTKNNALPPINPPVDAEIKPEVEAVHASEVNNNPAPPTATVYQFQAPPPQPMGRLPPIQQA